MVDDPDDGTEGRRLAVLHTGRADQARPPLPDADRHARRYASLPIEAKESFRWLTSAREAAQRLAGAEHRTVICDREGDIYDLLAEVPDARTTLVVRSRSDRRLASDGPMLYAELAAAPATAATLAIAGAASASSARRASTSALPRPGSVARR